MVYHGQLCLGVLDDLMSFINHFGIQWCLLWLMFLKCIISNDGQWFTMLVFAKKWLTNDRTFVLIARQCTSAPRKTFTCEANPCKVKAVQNALASGCKERRLSGGRNRLLVGHCIHGTAGHDGVVTCCNQNFHWFEPTNSDTVHVTCSNSAIMDAQKAVSACMLLVIIVLPSTTVNREGRWLVTRAHLYLAMVVYEMTIPVLYPWCGVAFLSVLSYHCFIFLLTIGDNVSITSVGSWILSCPLILTHHPLTPMNSDCYWLLCLPITFESPSTSG